MFKFDNVNLELKTQTTQTTEISDFSRVPAFIVNVLLITLPKWFTGQKYMSSASLQFDACTKISALI